MHSPSVDSPPAPSPYRTAVRTAIVLGLCSLVLLILVAAEWHPLLSVDGDVSRTTHRWAVADPDVTQAFRILTDWVWDPLTMRLLCAAVALWLVWRRAAWWTAVWLVTVSAVGTALQQGLKAALGRERPVWTDPVDSAHYAAYPSGHALTATVVLGLLLWLLHRHGSRPRPVAYGDVGGARLGGGRRSDPRLAGGPLAHGRRRRLAHGRDAGVPGDRGPCAVATVTTPARWRR